MISIFSERNKLSAEGGPGSPGRCRGCGES